MDSAGINQLLQNPSESLSVELKRWLDPSLPAEAAKIGRALIALRNNNGGLLVIGFDDTTREPLTAGRPANVEKMFHPDVVQGIVKSYCEPTFEVVTHFGDRDRQKYPVLDVAAGVRTPTMSRQEVSDPTTKKKVLRQYGIYVRSIHNTVVESVEPRSRADWDELVERCFDNREADVGRFLQRHAPAIASAMRREIQAMRQNDQRPDEPPPTPSSTPSPTPTPTPAALVIIQPTLEKVLERGRKNYNERLTFLRDHRQSTLTDRRGWREVAITCTGPLRDVPLPHLLEELFARHPRLTGWPVWIDSRGSSREESRPYANEGSWEALVTLQREGFVEPMIDFWRLEPEGRFYHRRSFDDDAMGKKGDGGVNVLDFLLVVSRTTEALATAQAFGRALSADPDKATLRVALVWTGLRDRHLVSWVDPMRDIYTATPAYQDSVTSELEMPLTTPPTALTGYVADALKPFFAVFGFQLAMKAVEQIASKTLRR